MARAYRQGLRKLSAGARFVPCALLFAARRRTSEGSAHLVPAITEVGRPRWMPVLSNGRLEKTIGERTIVPLIQLRLLEPAAVAPVRLLISGLGIATWRLFLRRGGQFLEDLTRV
jgi:hypothetical protein